MKKKLSESDKIEIGNLMEEACEKLCFSRYSVASLFGIRSLRFSGLGQHGGFFG